MTATTESILSDFKKFKKEFLEHLISKNPEIKDFLNADCDCSTSFSRIGEEICFIIFMMKNNYYFKSSKRIFISFKSLIINILGYNYCSFSMLKIEKIIFNDLNIKISISFNKKENNLYLLEFESL